MEFIKTKRLIMTIAKQNDLPALEEIEKECNEYFVFDPPNAAEYNRSLRECLTIGDIIPDVSEENYNKNNYVLLCIWQNDVLIGWLAYYLEYNQKDTAYLSLLYIKNSYRASGIGAEIVEALTQKLAEAQYKTIKTHCSLRNALALRFWVKNGFNYITEVECDGNLTPENFGGLGLMKIIVPNDILHIT